MLSVQANSNDDPKYEKFYKGSRWRNFRKTVFIEKGVYCTECLKESRYTVADTIHHVIEVRTDFEKRYDMNNVTPVCNSCHNKIHSNIKGARNKKEKTTKSYAVVI